MESDSEPRKFLEALRSHISGREKSL